MEEFIKSFGWIIGLAVQGFIAYHIFVLSKRTNFRNKLESKKEFKEKVQKLVHEAYALKSRRTKVMIVNVNQINKYPNGGCFADSIKSADYYEGIEMFIWGRTIKIYITPKNKLSRKSKGNTLHCEVQKTGIIPYKWIESVELSGDEFNTCAQIYCKFRKFTPIVKFNITKRNLMFKNLRYLLKFRLWNFSPYGEIIYYTVNEDFVEGVNKYWEEYSFFCKEKELKSIKPKQKD